MPRPITPIETILSNEDSKVMFETYARKMADCWIKKIEEVDAPVATIREAAKETLEVDVKLLNARAKEIVREKIGDEVDYLTRAKALVTVMEANFKDLEINDSDIQEAEIQLQKATKRLEDAKSKKADKRAEEKAKEDAKAAAAQALLKHTPKSKAEQKGSTKNLTEKLKAKSKKATEAQKEATRLNNEKIAAEIAQKETETA